MLTRESASLTNEWFILCSTNDVMKPIELARSPLKRLTVTTRSLPLVKPEKTEHCTAVLPGARASQESLNSNAPFANMPLAPKNPMDRKAFSEISRPPLRCR